MAISYALPPWLAGRPAPNPAEAFISNLGHGIAIGQQSARAAQEYAMQAQRIAAAEREAQRKDEQEQALLDFKQQQLQEQSLVDQQKLEVQKAYNEQRGMLRQDALKQVQAKVELAARTAAAKLAAQKQYTDTMNRIAQLEESGQIGQEQADAARRKTLMQFGPSMGAPLGSLAQLGKPGFTPTIEMVKGPDGSLRKVLRTSPNKVEDLTSKETPMKTRVTVNPFGTTVSGSPEAQAVKDALAKQAAENAPATNAPASGFMSKLGRMLGVESMSPNAGTAPAPAQSAPGRAETPAQPPAAQYRYNPKTRKIEAVGSSTSTAPTADTAGEQATLDDIFGDLPEEEEGTTTPQVDDSEEDDLEE